MRSLLTVPALLLIALPGYAEFIEEWNIEYESTLKCQTTSDVCHREITTIDSSSKVSKFAVTGPVILAIENRQIVSCESNAILSTEQARIFDLDGNQVATVIHRGFLRDCDITSDGVLYWFHYNKVIDSMPKNILVVVTNMGEVVDEQVLSKGGRIKFSYGEKEYELSIQEPQLPG